ncbi:Rieske (2Fe-2S) protein [Tessaracoccus antarcticus]|uniref:Rieske (2Fe-2S) protein n=1 Tax=Tessaracoccus antarcticus TaxID=2479848 RepID=A0A3M0G407_9ACTN|nr:Rieske (2Fe-2S) protein [Tessaracoccus antarcticus]RMB59710.1 Rieske (2Fe-2S) protein [Tessaracoccus antarcticus]
MSTRRELLASGAAIAAAMLVGCSNGSNPEDLVAVTVAKSDIPVGGGVVRAESGVVITQPEAGTFLGFTSVCTHQQCDVREVREDGIYCACHGSLFSITDGSPTAGPASAPLGFVVLVDNGDSLTHTP